MNKSTTRYWQFFALLIAAAAFAYVLFVVPAMHDEARRQAAAPATGSSAGPGAGSAESAARYGNGNGPEREQVARGGYLAGAANCMRCHGHPATLAESAESGFAVFSAAVRGGVRPGGAKIDYNKMPYVEFYRITDQDMLDIYAFFWAAASASGKPTAAWATVSGEYFKLAQAEPADRFVPDRERSANWNRGRYLVSNVAACGFCHGDGTSSVMLGGRLKNGWEAYNITPDLIEGIGVWSSLDLKNYLRYGANHYGTASGSMAAAVDSGLGRLNDRDMDAVHEYLRTVPAYGGGTGHARYVKTRPAAMTPEIMDSLNYMVPMESALSAISAPAVRKAAQGKADGAAVYTGNCATCHGMNGEGSGDWRFGGAPVLYGNSTVASPSPTNLRRVLEAGVERRRGNQTIIMPAFEQAMSAAEKDAVMDYVAERFGNRRLPVATAVK